MDFCFAPGFTDYRKRLQYQVSDVTGMVKTGENFLTAELADGCNRDRSALG
jgi:alpha-L-rhamnosidase